MNSLNKAFKEANDIYQELVDTRVKYSESKIDVDVIYDIEQQYNNKLTEIEILEQEEIESKKSLNKLSKWLNSDSGNNIDEEERDGYIPF